MRKENGITLIALVITIVVLVILGGVSVYLVLGQNGIITRAQNAKTLTEQTQANEQAQLAKADEYIEGSREQITIDKQEYEELKASKPTGIKSDIYVQNVYNNKASYSNKTTMNAFTKTTDSENKISEYLSYSDEKGYIAQKTGWYFIKTEAYVHSSNATDLYVGLYINENEIMRTIAWSTSSIASRNSDNTSMWLNKGDTIYANASSNGATAITKTATIEIYPMF